MRIYRIEHEETHEGPYSSFLPITDELVDAHNNDPQHPSPDMDGVFGTGPYVFGLGWPSRYGFESLSALQRWFAGWEKRLTACGFVIAVYEVKPEYTVSRQVAMGRRQLAFNPTHFERVETMEFQENSFLTRMRDAVRLTV